MKKRVSLLLVWVMVVTLVSAAVPPGQAEAAAKVKLSRSAITLKVGSSKKLTLKNAKGKVIWKSLKKSVATVNKKGLVKAKKVGTAVVVATNRSKSYMCTVIVKKKSKPVTDDIDDEEIIPEPTETETPIQKPTPTPTVTPKPTSVPSLSDAQENRMTLISYLKSHGSKDNMGNWAIEDKQTKTDRLIMTKASTDGEIIALQCGAGMKTSDGAIMTSVLTVVFTASKDISAVNCIVNAETSYGTTMESSTVEATTYLFNIESENNHLSWNVDEKSGYLYDEDELCELADTCVDLFYPWMNILLMVKCGGMTLEKLGFGN